MQIDDILVGVSYANSKGLIRHVEATIHNSLETLVVYRVVQGKRPPPGTRCECSLEAFARWAVRIVLPTYRIARKRRPPTGDDILTVQE
jgi:hypothetical protein